MGKGICLSLLLCLGRPVASPGPVLALGPTHSWWGWDWGIFWGAHIYGSLEFPSTDESCSSNLLICLLSFSFPVMLEKGKVMPSVDLACCLEAGRVVITFLMGTDSCAVYSIPVQAVSQVTIWTVGFQLRPSAAVGKSHRGSCQDSRKENHSPC